MIFFDILLVLSDNNILILNSSNPKCIFSINNLFSDCTRERIFFFSYPFHSFNKGCFRHLKKYECAWRDYENAGRRHFFFFI